MWPIFASTQAWLLLTSSLTGFFSGLDIDTLLYLAIMGLVTWLGPHLL